jgi:uncharacterized membrane protein YdjX (TVP38/TMEM64 family)
MTNTEEENKPRTTAIEVEGKNIEQATESVRPDRKKAVIKASIFVAFVILAIYVFKFTPARGYLSAKKLGNFLDSAGAWAPLVFVLVYAAGICLFLPGTLLTGLGAAIFGAYWGFFYVWLGAMIGASGAFWIGRTLGRDFAASLIGDKLKNMTMPFSGTALPRLCTCGLSIFPLPQ